MQSKEKYLETWQGKDLAAQIIELAHGDFEAKKQGESFKFLLNQIESVNQTDDKSNDELIKALTDFIESQPFNSDNLKKCLLLIVKNCFASLIVMKAKGKLIWQNSLIVLTGAYKSDVKVIANIINFKPQTRPNESRHKEFIETVKQDELTAAQTVVLDDDTECDTCPGTISKDELPIGKGEAKRAHKRRNK